MQKYKTGQVAAALFSSKKSDAQSSNNALTKLFSNASSHSKPRNAKILPKESHHSSTAAQKVHLKKRKSSSSSNHDAQHVKVVNASPKPSKKDRSTLPPQTETKNLNSSQLETSTAKLKKRKKKTKSKIASYHGDTEVEKASKLNSKGGTDKGQLKTKTLKAKEPQAIPKKRKLKDGAFEDVTTTKKVKLKDGTDEDGTVKRPRRDRQRDKTADNRTIFVGNCPLSADKKTLKTLFKRYGQIETIRFRCAPPGDPNLPKRAIVITKNFHEQCESYVAYIVFKEEESAKQALEKNGYLLEKLHLRVDIAASSKKHDKKRSIFVGNLPFTAKEEEIRSHFEDCGTITNIRIVRDRQTSLGKGICYVQFDSKDAVTLALKLNGSDYQGRALRVMTCSSKAKVKDKEQKRGKTNKFAAKPEKKKPSFAPSNLSNTSFRNKLKAKKEKRMRKMKKKKEASKRTDGLSAIFGDLPAAKKMVKAKRRKPGGQGKPMSGGGKKRTGDKGGRKFSQKGSSFKGKGKGGKR